MVTFTTNRGLELHYLHDLLTNILNMAYSFFLYTHSWIRWIVLLLAAFLVIRSLMGLFSDNPYQKLDNALSGSFVGFMHLQTCHTPAPR